MSEALKPCPFCACYTTPTVNDSGPAAIAAAMQALADLQGQLEHIPLEQETKLATQDEILRLSATLGREVGE